MKRWLVIFLLLCSPASAQVKWEKFMVNSGGAVATCDASHGAAGNFLARTSGLDTTHQNAYVTMICGGVTDGWWAKMDAFYIFATADTTTAGLNLVSSSFPITANGPPTFNIDAGYTGTDGSTTIYLDTGYNLQTNSVQNSAHVSCWLNTLSGGVSGSPCLGADDGSTWFTDIFPKFVSDNKAYYRANDGASASAGVARASGVGDFIASRTGASTQAGYYNGVSDGVVSVTSGAPGNMNLYILNNNRNGTPTGGIAAQIMQASIGTGLSATDAANLCSRVNAYLVTIAAVSSVC